MNEITKTRITNRWSFLEQEHDPCGVVSQRMEVLYLNAAARLIIPADWFGRRCWQAFPVQDDRCASRCLAVWAVGHSHEIVYCEETIYPGSGVPIMVGVAVTPLGNIQADGEQAILLLRPKPADSAEDAFQRALLDDARRLQSLSLANIKTVAD
jgi:hypothetical protein